MFLRISLGLVGLISLFTFSGCKENREIQNWIENTSQLRVEAERYANDTPYRQNQHLAFKAYFSALNQLALKLKGDESFRQRFNEVLAKTEIKEVCLKLFMSQQNWDAIVNGCTRNRLFLCAEEVRSYYQFNVAISGQLDSEQKRRFTQESLCR